MPFKLKRYQETGDFHFLTFSCHARQPYLASAASRDLFELALEQIRRLYVFFVFGYVAMPEHVHLLVSESKRGTLDRAVQALKRSVSKQSKQRPFWLPRYYDFNVRSEKKRVEKLRYMYRHPVVRGLARKPEDWKWSSFRHHLTGENGIVQIESWWTAGRRNGLTPQGESQRTEPPP